MKRVQRELAAALARRGEASLAELAADVGRSINGVSQSIGAVCAAGLAEPVGDTGWKLSRTGRWRYTAREARYRATGN